MTMNQILEHAHQFCAQQTTTGNAGADLDDVKRDILKQLGAVEDIRLTFKGNRCMENLFDSDRHETPVSLQSRRRSEPAQKLHDRIGRESSFPEVFTQDQLPPYEQLVAAVMDYYESRRTKGLPINHTLLRYLTAKLMMEDPFHALELVEAVYASHHVHGPLGAPFDNDIFQKWFHLVSVTGSLSSAVRALWAMMDSGRHLDWTLHFAYLAHFVSIVHLTTSILEDDKPGRKMWDRKSLKRERKEVELEYLRKRIWRIRVSLGPQDDFRFPDWREWEVQLRESLC